MANKLIVLSADAMVTEDLHSVHQPAGISDILKWRKHDKKCQINLSDCNLPMPHHNDDRKLS